MQEQGMNEKVTSQRTGPINRFELGQLAGTPAALEAIARAGQDVRAFLDRHVAGDWGAGNAEKNEYALREADTILSVYETALGEEFWIITEWNRAVTTICFPSER
jgi:hypothetical protein